jgi:hypothetical protein
LRVPEVAFSILGKHGDDLGIVARAARQQRIARCILDGRAPGADNASPRRRGAALVCPVNQRYFAALARKVIGSAAAEDARAYYDDFHLMLRARELQNSIINGCAQQLLAVCQ